MPNRCHVGGDIRRFRPSIIIKTDILCHIGEKLFDAIAIEREQWQ
jgi:hypothetical protein